MRTCLDCGYTGPAQDFAKHAASKFGRRNVCQTCFRRRVRKYAERQRAKLTDEARRALNERVASRFSRLQYAARVGGRHVIRNPVACTLTLEQYATLVSQPCHYCGGALPATGFGLDRKVAGGPYSIDNVVPCCVHCNSVKGDNFTPAEMLGRSKDG